MKIDKMIRALEQIAKWSPECGCSPCTGSCSSKEVIEIALGHMQDLARGALSAHGEEQPVAYVTGYFAGKCTVMPINSAMVLPVNMALYSHPQTTPVAAVPEGYALVLVEPTPEIIAAAAIAAWPTASAVDIEMARAAARIVLMSMDMTIGATLEQLTMAMATMAPAYRAMLAAQVVVK